MFLVIIPFFNTYYSDTEDGGSSSQELGIKPEPYSPPPPSHTATSPHTHHHHHHSPYTVAINPPY